ncbi:MAG TPA: YchJ family protein [Candidatus Krumholzibacteria bacterium]|nr:YchJ family protein [Candidatus Krumholzibacteria bacterium]
MNCPCGSGASFADCCEPVVTGARPAATAEQLMRARYSAYATANVDFLTDSLHPEHRDEYDPEGAREWAEQSEWHGLEILATDKGGEDDDEGTVEFAATYTYNGEFQRYHEVGSFLRADGRWYFVEGAPGVRRPVVREEPKIGRNDPCPCGSGRKYKRCCGA